MKKKLILYTKCLVLATGLCTTHISFCSSPEKKSVKKPNPQASSQISNTTRANFVVCDEENQNKPQATTQPETAPTVSYILQSISKQDKPGASKRDVHKAKGWFGSDSAATRKKFIDTNITEGHAEEALSDPEFRGDLGTVLTESMQTLTTISDKIATAFDTFESQRKAAREAFEQKQKNEYEAFIKEQRTNLQAPAQQVHNLLAVYELHQAQDIAPADMKKAHEQILSLQKAIEKKRDITIKSREDEIIAQAQTEKKFLTAMEHQLLAQKNLMRTLRRQTQNANNKLQEVSSDEDID